MFCKLAFATLAVLIGNDFASAQQIPPTTTAAELWNPWTWFWPYAIASAEGYRDYFEKAQKATNELYQQIYKTNAFPWVTGNWGLPQTNPGGSGGQSNQGNSTQNGGKPANENKQNQTTNGTQGQGGASGNGTSNAENSTQNGSKPANENKQNETTNGSQGQGGASGNSTSNAENSTQNNPPANENKQNQNANGTQVEAGASGNGTSNAGVNGKV